MKKVFCFIVAVFFCISISQAQGLSKPYAKVKVTLKSGQIIKGKKALINDKSISFSDVGAPRTYPLSDVALVEAKKGTAGYWALGCGGGCLAIGGIALAMNDPSESGYETSDAIPGLMLWVAVSAGVGVLIGSLTDKYKTVYITSGSSMIDRFDLKLSQMQLNNGTPENTWNLTVSYKF